MAAYQSFTSARGTRPDPIGLLLDLRAAVSADVGLTLNSPTWQQVTLKKTTAWTAPQIAAAQTVLDTAPAGTPQIAAQRLVDAMSLYDKARDLALIDALNVIRVALSPPKVDITPAQALAAIRTKAGTL